MPNHLRERRQRAGLTDLAGASRSTVRLFEGGYQPARRDARERIERGFAECYTAEQLANALANRSWHEIVQTVRP